MVRLLSLRRSLFGGEQMVEREVPIHVPVERIVEVPMERTVYKVQPHVFLLSHALARLCLPSWSRGNRLQPALIS